MVITAECDVPPDDDQRYANALQRAGVPVEYKDYPGMIHVFLGTAPAVDNPMNAQRIVWAAIRRAFT
jgi:acetyl esterase